VATSPTRVLALSLLTVNTGSSSLKVALYRIGASEELQIAILADRIGRDDGRLRATDRQGMVLLDQACGFANHEAALAAALDWLTTEGGVTKIDGVGHRVVHGGPGYQAPGRVTPDLLESLEAIVAIDPDHLPQALRTIRLIDRRFPSIPQVACFDTAFHRTMPPVAQRYPLPKRYWEAGVRRYGFHGLSYEFVSERLRALDPGARRVIIAHLGNGASMAAIRDGASVDTTMGFTPVGGLMMSTRSGDLDPSVPLFLERSLGLSPDGVARLVNTEAGLLGISETSADMRDLLGRAATDQRAADAIDLFCYQARKFLGALAVVLGGVDTIVFTGGIGEHAAAIRRRICEGLDFLGIRLDDAQNVAGASIISSDDSAVTARVIPTNEELMVARHTYHVLIEGG